MESTYQHDQSLASVPSSRKWTNNDETFAAPGRRLHKRPRLDTEHLDGGNNATHSRSFEDGPGFTDALRAFSTARVFRDPAYMKRVRNRDPQGWWNDSQTAVVPSDFIRNDLAPLMHEVINGHLCHAELERVATEATSIDLESCVNNISAVQNAVAQHAAAGVPPPASMLLEMETVLANANDSIKRLIPLISQFRERANDSMMREIALRSSMGAKISDVMRSARGTVVHRGPLAASMFHLRAITEKSKRSANGK